MSTETSEKARVENAARAKQQAENEVNRLAAKTPFWTERVATAQRALNEAVEGKAAHDARLADAQTTFTAAAEVYDREAARYAAIKSEIERLTAPLEADLKKLGDNLTADIAYVDGI